MTCETFTVKKYKLINRALMDTSLTKSDVLALIYILERYNHKHGNSRFTFERMSKDLGTTERTCFRSTDKLVKGGYCLIWTKKGRVTNRYVPDLESTAGWSNGWCDPKNGMANGANPGTVDPSNPDKTDMVNPDKNVMVDPSNPDRNVRVNPDRNVTRTISSSTILKTTTTTPLQTKADDPVVVVPDLTPDQSEYIRLTLLQKQQSGDLKNPAGLRRSMEAMAANGKLDISGLDHLRSQVEPAKRRPVVVDTSTLPPEEALARARRLRERLNGGGA